MDLEEIADELYALAPDEFTAARDGAAKVARSAGAPDVAAALRALRRPAVAAWVVNLLVRERPEAVEALVSVGKDLREAQTRVVSTRRRAGGAEELRTLDERRREALAAALEEAAAVSAGAGRSLTGPVADEVRATLEAAVASPAAADAVRSGRLVKPLSYAGFGELPDLADAVEMPRSASGPATSRATSPASKTAAREGSPPAKASAADARAERRAREHAQAQQAALEAAGAADDAQTAYERAEAAVADARAAEDLAAERVTRLEEELADARGAADAARAAKAQAERRRRQAYEQASKAHAAADGARRRLAKLSP